MIAARPYYQALRGRLTGISDRALATHVELYDRMVDRLNAIESRMPLIETPAPASTFAPGAADVLPAGLLGAKVSSLQLTIAGPLAAVVAQVLNELNARGISFVPNLYLGTSGDGDFWTTDVAISINIPWFLANATLWRLAARQGRTSYTPAQVAKVLRHEIGHALGYAFRLHERSDWRELFGDFAAPYRDEFRSVPRSTDHVEYLDTVSAHYPQKHPDEDWAEAFACWLDPTSKWASEYGSWPVALDKLRYVDFLWSVGAMAGAPPNGRLGRVEPYTMVDGTVGDLLGAVEGTQPFRGLRGWSEHAELLRSEAEAYNGVVLHEAMWDVLGTSLGTQVGAGIGQSPLDDPGMGGIGEKYGTLLGHVRARWGGWEAYVRELRAILGATSGWALTVWDPRRRQLGSALVEGHAQGVPAGCRLVLALDAHEHAYAVDYAGRKDVGMAALMRNVDWGLVEARVLEPVPVVVPELGVNGADAVAPTLE